MSWNLVGIVLATLICIVSIMGLVYVALVWGPRKNWALENQDSNKYSTTKGENQ